MKKWAVYMHICPDGLCYIGKTFRPPLTRWTSGSKYRKNADFYESINKNGGESEFLSQFKHYTLSADECTWVEWHRDMTYKETNIFDEDKANTLAKKFIDIYDSMNPEKGYNRTSGGDKEYFYSSLSIERNAKAHEGMFDGEKNPFSGKTHSDETKQLLSQLAQMRTGDKNPFSGKHHTDETKEKLRQSHLGRYDGEKNPFHGQHHTEEIKRQLSEQHQKTVSSYDLTGKRQQTFPSVSSAAEEMGVSISSISACATKQTRTSCKLIWRFSDAEQLPENELP